MLLDGERTSGQDVRTANVTASMAIANIVKSSLGPVGLDKMLVDDIGDVTITNDGATILQQLEVEHPAAKVLVELAHLQDQEVGDGTTSVVIVAAELLKRGNELVMNKVHPTSIMSGYRLALKEAVKFIKEKLVVPVDQLQQDNLLNAARTSMSSKILGPESDFFAQLAVDAVQSVKTESTHSETGKIGVKYPVSAIHILKCHGQSSLSSHLVDGFAIAGGRAAQGMPTSVTPAKIALLDFSLQRHKMQLGVSVVVKDVKEVELIRQREMDITKERIQKILEAGANVVLTTKGIDDLAMKYFVEAGAMAVRRVKKEDLKRIAKATGGQVVGTLADMEGNEAFDPGMLGVADMVEERRVGDGEMLYIRLKEGGKGVGRAATIVLRGANDYMLDEMDRALHDSLMVVKRMLESNSLVAGGGAVEAALSIHLEEYAMTLGSKEQLAIAAFSEALLVIPRTLAVNAAQDATELVANLRAAHFKAQQQESTSTGQQAPGGMEPMGGGAALGEEGDGGGKAKKNGQKDDLWYAGLDLFEGVVRNNLAAGVVEPAISKIKSLRFATEAAITILRIDDLIKLTERSPGPPGGMQGMQ
ncbi:t-complex protein alpha subunit [Nannochloropsis oceanica]